jgi:hypothetical protein
VGCFLGDKTRQSAKNVGLVFPLFIRSVLLLTPIFGSLSEGDCFWSFIHYDNAQLV